MSDESRNQLDALLRRVHDRIDLLETRLRAFEAQMDAEIQRAFEEANPVNSKAA